MNARRLLTPLLLAAATLPGLHASTPQAPSVGHSYEEVVALLGRPGGSIQLQDSLVLFYERGEVILRSGAVSEVRLESPADHQARLAAESAAREAAAARRLDVALQRRAALLSDGSILSRDASTQLAAWRKLALEHPALPADAAADARIAVLEDLARQEREASLAAAERALTETRLRALEAELAAANARAARAEADAHAARATPAVVVQRVLTPVVVRRPVVVRPCPTQPPPPRPGDPDCDAPSTPPNTDRPHRPGSSIQLTTSGSVIQAASFNTYSDLVVARTQPRR